ncbi:hypothetical protein K474DRAFT_1678134 [Panus rudis PR-1116 ss-1]|nr:hypothetical protein K474DRAFT_1678134 [Panus rudis PR-1116 ss-1]
MDTVKAQTSSPQSNPVGSLNQTKLLQLLFALGYISIEVAESTESRDDPLTELNLNPNRRASIPRDHAACSKVVDAFLDLLAAVPAMKGGAFAVAIGNATLDTAPFTEKVHELEDASDQPDLVSIPVYLACNDAVQPSIPMTVQSCWEKLQRLRESSTASDIDHASVEQ